MTTRLFLDFNHLAIRTLFCNISQDWSNGFDFHKHLLLNTLISNIKKFKPEEVIVAVDSYKNWRKLVYSDYKANRKIEREASTFDWNSYFEYINVFTEELKVFPFKIIQVDYTEADDIIAVLSKELSDSENIIVTSDSDYIQLLQYNQNKLYDPIKKKFIEEVLPLRALKIKVLTGDKGDNIPPIKERLGEKTAIKILSENKLDSYLSENKLVDKYNLNNKLISFSEIPLTIQKEILKRYSTYTLDKEIDYYTWFATHKLRELSMNFHKIFPVLQNLKLKMRGKTNESIF